MKARKIKGYFLLQIHNQCQRSEGQENEEEQEQEQEEEEEQEEQEQEQEQEEQEEQEEEETITPITLSQIMKIKPMNVKEKNVDILKNI